MAIDFEIKIGNVVVFKNGQQLTIDNLDGKYLYMADGSQFKKNHPDIAEILHEAAEASG